MIFDARTNELEAFNDSNHVLTKNVLQDMWMEDKNLPPYALRGIKIRLATEFDFFVLTFDSKS